MQYLLPCDCGASVAVSASQAGERVVCTCGASLEVPKLRALRDFPQAEATPAPSRSARGWGLRQGILTAGLLLCLPLAAGALWFVKIEPQPPVGFNAERRSEIVESGVSRLAPAEAWAMWAMVYRPLATNGFEVVESPYDKMIEHRIEQCRLYRNVLAAGAAVVLAGSVLASVLLPH